MITERPPKLDPDIPADEWVLRPGMPSLELYSRRLAVAIQPDAIRTLYLLAAANEPLPSSDLPADSELLYKLNRAQMIGQRLWRERHWEIYFYGRLMLLAIWVGQHGDISRLAEDDQEDQAERN